MLFKPGACLPLRRPLAQFAGNSPLDLACYNNIPFETGKRPVSAFLGSDFLDEETHIPAPARPKPAHAQAEAEGRVRGVRSFVLRNSRLTEGQQRAMRELLPRFEVTDGSGLVDFAVQFGNGNPVILEIGFGNGEATWQMARQEPGLNFIGAEVHRPGVGHLLLRLEEYALNNVRITCTDGVQFLRERVAAGSLAGLRLYFPDPWPKKRHHKRRMVQPLFLDLLAEKLQPGAIVHFATDWQDYAEHMLALLQQHELFENLSYGGSYSPRPPWRPLTKYEQRGQRLGHGVYDLLFRRRVASELRAG
jgi:tRNA (guanine-N7-)-methyltransferase